MFDGLEDLVGKLAGRDEDEGGCESSRVGLNTWLLAKSSRIGYLENRVAYSFALQNAR